VFLKTHLHLSGCFYDTYPFNYLIHRLRGRQLYDFLLKLSVCGESVRGESVERAWRERGESVERAYVEKAWFGTHYTNSKRLLQTYTSMAPQVAGSGCSVLVEVSVDWCNSCFPHCVHCTVQFILDFQSPSLTFSLQSPISNLQSPISNL
jgi:hypothetical protein